MFAARTGGTVRNKSSEFKRQSSQAKISTEKDNVRHRTLVQIQQKARRLALLRELEMSWYLKACQLSYEYTVAYTSGMPHR